MDVEFEHKIEHVEPLSVEVERGQRGGYGWKIKLYGVEPTEVVDIVAKTDQRLRELFLVKGEEHEPVERSG
jgi:hypothetical protein